jgi:hypothetical protein
MCRPRGDVVTSGNGEKGGHCDVLGQTWRGRVPRLALRFRDAVSIGVGIMVEFVCVARPTLLLHGGPDSIGVLIMWN